MPPLAILELAALLRRRAGERASFVAEQFAFQQGLGQRGAIDGDEGLVARGHCCDGWRGPPVPCRCRSRRDQHRGGRGGDALDQLVDFAHGRAVPHHVVIQIHFGAQAKVFAPQPLDLARAFHGHGGDARDGGDQLKIVFGETHHRIGSVEINQSDGFVEVEQRDTDQRVDRRCAGSFAGIVAEDADRSCKTCCASSRSTWTGCCGPATRSQATTEENSSGSLPARIAPRSAGTTSKIIPCPAAGCSRRACPARSAAGCCCCASTAPSAARRARLRDRLRRIRVRPDPEHQLVHRERGRPVPRALDQLRPRVPARRGVPAPGSRFANPVLAETSQKVLAVAEAACRTAKCSSRARRAWYSGFVAEAIGKFAATEVMDVTGERHRGFLTAHDLSSWHARLEAPVTDPRIRWLEPLILARRNRADLRRYQGL